MAKDEIEFGFHLILCFDYDEYLFEFDDMNMLIVVMNQMMISEIWLTKCRRDARSP